MQTVDISPLLSQLQQCRNLALAFKGEIARFSLRLLPISIGSSQNAADDRQETAQENRSTLD
jgi:hypothetical protein